jgi:hypothetical protein
MVDGRSEKLKKLDGKLNYLQRPCILRGKHHGRSEHTARPGIAHTRWVGLGGNLPLSIHLFRIAPSGVPLRADNAVTNNRFSLAEVPLKIRTIVKQAEASVNGRLNTDRSLSFPAPGVTPSHLTAPLTID